MLLGQTIRTPEAVGRERLPHRARADYKPRTMSTLQTVMALTAAAAVGTAYVLIHEHRRKLKTHRKKSDGAQGGGGGGAQRQGRSNLISRDLLLAILAESATAAFQLIEQVCSLCPRAPLGPHMQLRQVVGRRKWEQRPRFRATAALPTYA